MNEHIINLTLDINCKKTITRLFMGQYDIGRKAEVTVTADGEPYTCKNCTVVCQGVRGDNTHFAFDCTVNSAGHIITTFDEILKSSGIAFAKFVISDSTHSYSTEKIIIDCENALLGNIVNVNDYVILNQLIERLHALSESGAVLVDTELSENSSNPIANYVIASIIYKLIETKADTIKLLPACEGAMTFTPYSNFILGQVGSTSGTYNPDIKYRVTSEDIMKFDYDLNVSVDSGFTAYVVKYSNGSYVSIKSLSDDNGYTILAGTEFRLHIRRNPENTAETANINEFVNAVKFQTKIAYDVDNIRTELSENVQTANESKQIISEDVRNVTTMNRTETHTTNPFVCIAYEFKKGLSYTIEYSASASVSRIVTTATNSISSSQVVETIATGDLQNGTIVFSPKSDGAKYLTFVGAEKGAEGEKIALTITGKIASSLLEKVKNVDTSVSEISNVITRNLYNETSLYNSRSSGGFVSFPFEFEVGKRYKITFSSNKEVDYIYNQNADTISSDDRVETIASPGVHGTIVYYTPTVAGGKYLVFRCADRKAEMWVDVNVVYSLSDTIDSINNEIKNIKENGIGDPIPDYYYEGDYLPQKINEIRKACSVLHGVTFGFITDIHLKKNQGQSKKLLRKIMDETNVPFVLCGGDIVYLLGTEEELYEQITDFNEFKSCIGKDRLFCTRGNHDLYNGERENLFDFDAWADSLLTSVPGSNPVFNGTLGAVDKSGGYLSFSSNGSDCYTRHFGETAYKISVMPKTSYSLSFKQEGSQGSVFVFFNGQTGTGNMVSTDSSGGKLLFTTNEDTTYITLRFGIAAGGTTATVSDIKLYKDDNVLTTADVYDTLFRDTETKVSSMSVDNGCYCIDNEPQKTRIIMLNTTDVSGDFDYEGGGVSFRSGTLQWLSAALTEKTDYKIIIVCHTPLNYETFTNDVDSGENRDGLSLMVQAFKNKTEFETTRFETTVNADFTNTTNELICVISGHRHIDDYSLENNVLNIVTTCDCIDKKDGYNRKAGTINEQAIDIYCINYDTNTINTVRIGAGSNREFTY